MLKKTTLALGICAGLQLSFLTDANAARMERIQVYGSYTDTMFYVDLYYGSRGYRVDRVIVHNSPLRGGGGEANSVSLTAEEEKEFYKKAHDKTPWTEAEKAMVVNQLATYIAAFEKFMNDYNISEPARARIARSLGAIGVFYSALQTEEAMSNHIANDNYTGAIVELAAFAGVAAFSAVGAVAIVGVASGGGLLIGTAIAAIGAYQTIKLKDFINERVSDRKISEWGRELGRRVDVEIWEANTWDFFQWVCRFYPAHKYDLIDGCENAIQPFGMDTQLYTQKLRSRAEKKPPSLDILAIKRSDRVISADKVGHFPQFDTDNDGVYEEISWVNPQYSVVFFDINGSGILDDHREFSFRGYSLRKEPTALNGLGYFDSNSDSEISISDALYEYLYLWTDDNANGLSEPNEVEKLSSLDFGIVFSNSTGGTSNDPARGFELKNRFDGESLPGKVIKVQPLKPTEEI